MVDNDTRTQVIARISFKAAERWKIFSIIKNNGGKVLSDSEEEDESELSPREKIGNTIKTTSVPSD